MFAYSTITSRDMATAITEVSIGREECCFVGNALFSQRDRLISIAHDKDRRTVFSSYAIW